MDPQGINSPGLKEHSTASSGTACCAICLDSLSLAGRVVKVICPNGHKLHADCLKTLRKYSQDCPSCRHHIYTSSSLSPLQEPLTQRAPSCPPSPINDSQLFYEDAPQPETFDDDMPLPEGPTHGQETLLALECIPGNAAEDDSSLLEGVVKLSAPVLRGEAPPADFIIVADVSGSMNEYNKIGQLKDTLNWLTDNLNERHRMSLITFNRTPRRETPLTVMNSAGKATQAAIIAGIAAGGDTDIGKALTMAAAVLEGRRHPNQVACVMLITDGQDNSGSLNSGGRVLARAQAAIASIAENSLFVSIGVGADHDAHLLSSLSDKARGSFQYCASSEEIAGTVGGPVGGVVKAVAVAAKLLIVSNGERQEIQFPLVTEGYTHFTPFKAKIGDTPYLKARLTYTPPGMNRERIVEIEGAAAELHATPETLVLIDSHKNREMVAAEIKNAVALADAHQLVAARSKLNDAITKVEASISAREDLCIKLIEECKRVLAGLRDQESYEQSGGAAVGFSSMQNSCSQSAYSMSSASATPSVLAYGSSASVRVALHTP